MRVASAVRVCSVGSILLFSTSPTRHVATAIPFRGRSRNGKDNANNSDDSVVQNQAAAAVVDAMMVVEDAGEVILSDAAAVGTVPSDAAASSRRNAVVESFFAATTTASTATNSKNEKIQYQHDELYEDIHVRAANVTEFVIETRRTLHQHPELMFQEEQTSRKIRALLTDMGISHTTGWGRNKHPDIHPGPGGFGIVADIGTGQEPCILLRADMDALPITERTAGIEDFVSRDVGKMHACGHDGHTAMLLGAAKLLKSMEDSLPGTVRIMFQPAEEGGAGGKRMREEGVLAQDPKPSHAFGMHVWPTLPSGAIAGRPGPLMAACERFEIFIAGVGGHAAMPHLTVDPVVAASSIVMNLQTIVSRTISPLESGVCSITKMEAGDAFNIIPASALLRGTIRALSTDTLLKLRDRVSHIVETTAAVHGANVTITYSPDYYPPTVNDPVLYEEFAKPVAALVAPEGVVRDTEPTMGAEDFSFLAEAIPSTFFFLGQGSATTPPSQYGLHHPHFAIDESILAVGVELHVNLAVRGLQKLLIQQRRGQQQQQHDLEATA